MSISIVIPTYNEVDSIGKLLEELVKIEGCSQIIVVDDNSPDNTSGEILFYKAIYPKIGLLKRHKAKGLGSAIRDGAAIALNKDILVMDGDGQHSPEDVQKIIKVYQSIEEVKNLEIYKTNLSYVIVGSRFLETNPEGLSSNRIKISKVLNFIANLHTKNKTSDPMTGFFIAKRHLIMATTTNGFKVLYNILHHNKYLNLIEMPISFKKREKGKSKNGFRELVRLMRI